MVKKEIKSQTNLLAVNFQYSALYGLMDSTCYWRIINYNDPDEYFESH